MSILFSEIGNFFYESSDCLRLQRDTANTALTWLVDIAIGKINSDLSPAQALSVYAWLLILGIVTSTLILSSS